MFQPLGTLAWLTETAVKQAGLSSYTEFLKTGHPPQKFNNYHKFMMLSFIVWGGGFLYVHQPLIATLTFVLMVGFHAILFFGTFYLDWMPDGLSPVHSLMIVSAMTIALWWLSIVVPFWMIPNKIREKTYHGLVFFLIVASVLTLLISQSVFLIRKGAVRGFEIEPEFWYACALWFVAIVFISIEGIGFGLKFIDRLLPKREAISNPWDSFSKGFTLGLIAAVSLGILLMGPGKDLVTFAAGAFIEKARALEFEDLPHKIERFATVWKQLGS